MVSILIPVYNYDISQLLEKLEQELVGLDVTTEIIILDDCSTDERLKAQNKSRAKHHIYLENNSNLGRVATRLKLAKQAQFECLLFLDADVLPVYPNFISKFLSVNSHKYDLIFGGIVYAKDPPESEYSLRWNYGKRREAKSLVERIKQPYASIISQHFFIHKETAITIFTIMDLDRYGMDILFTYLLKEHKVAILHIENPTEHLGLEKNRDYLVKTKRGLRTTYELETKGFIPKNYRPIQQKSNLISTLFLAKPLLYFISKYNTVMADRLCSKNPNLLIFDLYKLYHYLQLKSNS
ncbi:glycosyltransferase family 2 protein [Aquimarina brevivitae]|uniref:Glycosyl transferase family 2 n=1 Tax=Aquimarina brevivitae TaxID=323412 RepID=A0A4Q7NXE1_9FLAO|nr:glycosyltransferase family A protein [Aquimarina brevivitae]RZS91887.1 glycosyl transferase family 2 [Aquimarina brevivitae]